jgi:hypothetical protein
MPQQQQCIVYSMTLIVVVVVVVPRNVPNMDKNTIPDHINPLYTHMSLPVLQIWQELSEISMIDAYGKSPFPLQPKGNHYSPQPDELPGF